MKIYFSGSIRGGRQDADLYARMIERISDYGEVLTEHVGDKNLTSAGSDGGSTYIHDRDMSWLRSADLIIAECSTPSLGVGYELAYGEILNIPTHVFFGSARGHLSAMIDGSPAYKIHSYSSEAELMEQLDQVMRTESKKA